MSNGRASSLSSPSYPPSALAASRIEHILRVERRNLRWEVAYNGVTRPMIDWLCTRERAVDHALEIAERLLSHPGRERVLVVLEGLEHVFTNEVPAVQVTH
jgi:hypothetical protein